MFRLLPWGNKVTAEEVKMLAAPQRRSPIMEKPALHKLKRKRTNSSESPTTPGVQTALTKGDTRLDKVCSSNNNNRLPVSHPNGFPATRNVAESLPPKATNNQAPVPQNTQVSPGSGQNSPSGQLPAVPTQQTSSLPKMDVNKLRQTIESQLSLEVLLKHDELRLIDQEIAKCQAALEQLRRCSEIPFPGSNATGPVDSMSKGAGFAVLPSGTSRPPVSPSPWCLTDGPYSRHYARWLLPDPRFDGGEADAGALSLSAGNAGVDGRTTRGTWAESGSVSGKSRSQRGSTGSKLQALSSGYPQPKDKAGPMIIKRKTDGQIVKLVCLDCRRDNFSSTQGFINHCR